MGRMYGSFEQEFKKKYFIKGDVFMNKVIILGRISSDIEMSNVGNNYLSKFSVATNKTWKDKDGKKNERASFHNINAWGGTAKIVKEWSGKGKMVFIEGELEYQSWEKDGEKKYKTVINAKQITPLEWNKKQNTERGQEIESFCDESEIPF